MKIPVKDDRPILIAIAGPNGAGKTTFYRSYVAEEGYPFVNADEIALNSELDAYVAAELAETARREYFDEKKSFVFETVFSDPVGAKLLFLEQAVGAGYQVILCFVGISDPDISLERVALRVIEGGHDVPDDKIISRFPRTMDNLRESILRLPLVLVYNNDDARDPHRFVLAAGNGIIVEQAETLPAWLVPLLPKRT